MLFRTAHHSAMLEIELARRNIPFVKFGGLKFLEAAHVKDVLAVLRWAENPRDRVAGFRVLQLLPGIGPATAGKAARRAWRGRAADRRAGDLRAAAPRRAEHWRELVDADARACAARRPDGRPSSICVRQWYQPHLEQRYADAVVRAGDLDQLAAHRRRLRLARAVPDRAHARSAERHQRRGRRRRCWTRTT